MRPFARAAAPKCTPRLGEPCSRHDRLTMVADRPAWSMTRFNVSFDEIRPDVVVPFGGPGDGGARSVARVAGVSKSIGHDAQRSRRVDNQRLSTNCHHWFADRAGCGRSWPPIPSSPYAAAKWSATAYARMFHSLYQTPVVVLRPFMTYGPGQHETKIVPYVIDSLLQGKVRRHLSSGAWSADWVFVDDVIDGFLFGGDSSRNRWRRIIDLGCGKV